MNLNLKLNELNMKDLQALLSNNENVLKFLRQTGPFATSSANIQGQPPAKNIIEAKKYFSNEVYFYEDGGEFDSTPSTLVDLRGDSIKILREGAVKITED